MPNFIPVRINLDDLNNTPILDGQLLFVTNQDDGKNPIYLDIGSSRKSLGLYDWSIITNKPFNSIGNGLAVDENGTLYTSVGWTEVSNKPFNTIGNGLDVNSSNELVADVTWADIITKPFETIGSGLTVNSNNELTADIQTWSQILNKPFSSIGVGLDVVNDQLVAVGGGTGVDWGTEVVDKPFETIGGGLKVTDGALETDITLAWSSVTSKPFDTIGTGLAVVGGALTTNFTWANVSNKPFNTIGSGLVVESGVLKTDISFSWNDILNKPFTIIGNGLTVDGTALTADIKTVALTNTGTASYNTTAKQNLTVNGTNNYEILGTKYLQRTLTLDTTDPTVYTFTSSEINANSVIDIYSSIYEVTPNSVTVTENTGEGTYTVEIEYPPYNVSGTSMLCRIYIR